MGGLVSVIITTYKREPEVVCRAVESVLAQTYGNIELIIVDDSPKDYPLREQVRNAVMQRMPEANYLVHETNQGACAARNTGLAQAKGEFVAYLDDDDEWLPEKIEKQLVGFTNDRVGLVYCNWIWFDELRGIKEVVVTKDISKEAYAMLLTKNYIGSTSFPLIKKAYLDAIGGFDLCMPAAQDYDAWLRLAECCDIAFIPEPLIIYHVHEGEQITKSYAKKINGLERILEKHKSFLLSHPSIYGIKLAQLAPRYAGDKKLGKALSAWLGAIVRGPFNLKENAQSLKHIVCNFFDR